MLRVLVVSSFMPPHLGGLEVAAKTIFDAYKIGGCEARWIASQVPENIQANGEEKIRVRCWNGLERWFGVPWPVWGVVGVKRLTELIRWADVVHVHDCLYLCSALGVLFSRRLRKPVILSQHIGFVHYSSIVFNQLERLAYSTLGRTVLCRASHIAFCTPAAEEFVKRLLDKVPVASSLIPYGIDTERFKPASVEKNVARDAFGLPEVSPVVLFAGRLVEKKGVSLLIEMICDLPEYHFLMVGDGPLRPEPVKNLTWIPFIPSEQMPLVYQAADLFCLPSHSEGFPLAILEAMASGLPVVTSRGQTFGEILEREGAAMLADRDRAAFCQSVSRILETPQLRNSMEIRARELVERDYDIEHVGARYLELVKKLVTLS